MAEVKDRIIENSDEDIRRILGEMGIDEENLFDYSDNGDIYNDKLRDGLSEWEIEDAVRVKRFLRGLMLVTGDPGAGKGLFGNHLGYKIKHYFADRKALLDYKPKPPFGLYLPFDENFVNEELGKMAELSKVKGDIPKEIDREDKGRIKDVKGLADKWMRSDAGRVYLQKSVIILEEFKRYMHNRRPMNPFGITLGHIFTWWRHLDILVIGMTPFLNEIDVKQCQQYITHDARCSWMGEGVAKTTIYQTMWASRAGVLRYSGRPTIMLIDGTQESPELGVKYKDKDGTEHYYSYFEIYNSHFLPSIKGTRR